MMNRFLKVVSAIRSSPGSCPAAVVCLMLLFFFSGCATPVGVTAAGRNYGYAQIDQSALNSSELSSFSAIVLHRYDLERVYDKSPGQCLIELHQRATVDPRRDTLFALAEISYLLGKKDRKLKAKGRSLPPENCFAASVVYSYLFLLAPGEDALPDSFDRRFRMACDFYNRSLGYIITRRENQTSAGVQEWPLPVGRIVVRPSEGSDYREQLDDQVTLVSADRYRIRGLSVRNRNPGLGAPIVLVRQKKIGVGMTKSVAATVLLRVRGGLADISAGTLRGEVEIYSAFARDHVEIDGRQIPLEQDLTTPIAYALNNPMVWQVEKMLFRLGQGPL